MSEATVLFSATDDDGDTIEVKRFGLSDVTVTVRGEDGHRSVIVYDSQIPALIEALNHALTA